MLGNSQASRSYVFGRNDSQSQWTADTMATSFKELGRDEDARAFGATNTANTVRNKDSGGKETKSKQSLFAMMSQGADENTTKPDVKSFETGDTAQVMRALRDRIMLVISRQRTGLLIDMR